MQAGCCGSVCLTPQVLKRRRQCDFVFSMNLLLGYRLTEARQCFYKLILLCAGGAFLHLVIEAINQLAAMVPGWFLPHLSVALFQLWDTETYSKAERVSFPPCQEQDCILTEAVYCLDETLSLVLSLRSGPVTPWLLLSCSLIIIATSGNRFHHSAQHLWRFVSI